MMYCLAYSSIAEGFIRVINKFKKLNSYKKQSKKHRLFVAKYIDLGLARLHKKYTCCSFA